MTQTSMISVASHIWRIATSTLAAAGLTVAVVQRDGGRRVGCVPRLGRRLG